MSEVETAQTGAIADPAANTAPAQEQSQEAPQTTANAETDEQREEQARDEKGRFIQKRINELTRQRYEAQRERDTERQRTQQLEAELSRYRNPEPDPDTDPRAYVAHLAREEARRIVDSERNNWQQQQEQQRFQSIAAEHGTREEAYAKANPGYYEAAESFVSVVGANPQLAEVLMTSEHGPAVVDYLGQHLDEAARIAQLPLHLAAAQVARIEARVSAPKPKPVTKAPDPAPKVGGASAAPRGLADDIPIGEWMARRQAKL
jgi:hypothetical protein